MPIFSNRSLNCLKGVHPDMVRLMHEAIKDSPVDFTITCGVRTTEEQQMLYKQGGVTACDGVIKRSNHQAKADGWGYAVDLYPYVNGAVRVNDADSLIQIARHIKNTAHKLGVPIVWGGDWKMRDYPHFELSI